MAALYVLPFDHRGSFQKMLLEHKNPLTPEEHEKLKYYKGVIFEGFKKVVEKRGAADLAVLIDEEFGKELHAAAEKIGVRNLLSTEKSGKDVFEFEYDDWQDHLLEIRPTYAKALIRVVIGENHALQNSRLKELFDFCEQSGMKMLIEPLIQPSEKDLELAGGDKARFDAEFRPERFAAAVREIHTAGVFPDVWKIEGTETKAAMEICSRAVFDGGKAAAEIVILGRGESMAKVEHWLTVSATVKGVTGFAVGRTIFADALTKLKNGEYSEAEAVDEIAEKYEYFIDLFEQARN